MRNSSNLISELWEITTQFGDVYNDYAKKFNFYYNELAIFYSLYKEGSYTQKQICQEWLLPKQTINTLCKTFIAKGWIQTVEHTGDKREKLLSLTELGQSVAEPMIAPLLAVEDQTVANFGLERAKALIIEFRQFQRLFSQTFKHL